MWSSFDLVCHKNVVIIRNFNRISSRSYTKDYYSVLDIKRNSSRREIKHAYYRLSKKFHPDVNSEKNAEEKFKMIQEAYQVLGDDKKRLEYDMSLNEGYYPSESGPKRENAGFTARSYAKRTGPIHTGSTSAYNFDEYYKSHYGSTFKKPPTGGFAKHHSSKTMNEEELKNYWNTKEFSNENDYLVHKRSEYFIKSIVVGASLILVYIVLRKFKESEEELGRRTYLQNTQRNNTKD